jgi:hypothetical protein
MNLELSGFLVLKDAHRYIAWRVTLKPSNVGDCETERNSTSYASSWSPKLTWGVSRSDVR